MAVPAATPVITPDEEIVAIEVAELLQVPPATLDEKEVVAPTQIFCVPASVPALGAAVTVTVLVAVAFEHPPEPATVYVIVAVPAPTPVTTPVEALTVAIDVLEELQVPPLTVEAKVVVPVPQIVCVPDKVPEDGGAVTVTVITFELAEMVVPSLAIR